MFDAAKVECDYATEKKSFNRIFNRKEVIAVITFIHGV
jgi:hypothetical protein